MKYYAVTTSGVYFNFEADSDDEAASKANLLAENGFLCWGIEKGSRLDILEKDDKIIEW